MGVSFLGNGGGRVVVICCDSEVGAVRGVADGIYHMIVNTRKNDMLQYTHSTSGG
jgi:hypothetical protein